MLAVQEYNIPAFQEAINLFQDIRIRHCSVVKTRGVDQSHFPPEKVESVRRLHLLRTGLQALSDCEMRLADKIDEL